MRLLELGHIFFNGHKPSEAKDQFYRFQVVGIGNRVQISSTFDRYQIITELI